MTNDTKPFFEQYHQLINRIDDEVKKLEKLHTNKMQCKEGCSSCCESFGVMDLEFDYIQNYITEHNIALPPTLFAQRYRKRCRFLINNRCTIYPVRPIICRTHGLPILYRSEMGDHYQLSVCKLNFKGMKNGWFKEDNSLMMSPINSELIKLNFEYLKETQNKKGGIIALNPLHKLM